MAIEYTHEEKYKYLVAAFHYIVKEFYHVKKIEGYSCGNCRCLCDYEVELREHNIDNIDQVVHRGLDIQREQSRRISKYVTQDKKKAEKKLANELLKKDKAKK